MAALPENPASEAVPFGRDTALFLNIFFLAAWWIIDPRLIHHSLGITTCYDPFAFLRGWDFFAEHASRPGGLVEYACRLLTQFYGLGWSGAMVLTAAAACLVLGTDDVARCVGGGRGRLLRYLPAGWLLAMAAAYNHPLNCVLSLLAALAAFVLYARFAPLSAVGRTAALGMASLALYWLAGSGSLAFPLLAAVFELGSGGRKRVAAAALACGFAVPRLLAAPFGLDAWRAHAGFVFYDPGVWPPSRCGYVLALYLFFPAVLVGTAAWQAGVWRDFKKKLAAFGPRGAVMPMAATGAAFAAVLAAAWFSLDRFTRQVLEIDYYSQNEQWTEVVRAADELALAGAEIRSYRNTMLALHHLGLLGEAMFRYPQLPTAYWFSTPREVADFGSEFQESRLLLALGHVNYAEAAAHDALEICGPMPALLEHLAMIHIAKGRPDMARVLLHALEKHLFHGETARRMLERLELDPRLEDDPSVARIRRNMLLKETFASRVALDEFLRPLVDRNPGNAMAVDFLLAGYLSDARPEKAVELIRQMDLSAAVRIPRHYQEAMVICIEGLGALRSRIDPEVLARGEQFLRLVQQASSREAASEAALAAGFGDSYFYYFAMARWGR